MKIRGIEKLSFKEICDAVGHHGYRFIYYPYCVSALWSFRRMSSVRFVGPRTNRVSEGFGYALISLLFGWWGPMGLVWTPRFLWEILGEGGVDVTKVVLRALAPMEVSNEDRDRALAGLELRNLEKERKRKRLGLGGWICLLLAGLLFVGAATYVVASQRMEKRLEVLVVSGWDLSYKVEFGGVKKELKPGEVLRVEVPEGRHVVRTELWGELPVELRRGFFERVFVKRVGLVNPDRLAVVYREKANYNRKQAAGEEKKEEVPVAELEVYANETGRVVKGADYYFRNFPKSLKAKSRLFRASRTRLALLNGGGGFAGKALFVKGHLGEGAVEAYVRHLIEARAEDPEMVALLRRAVSPEAAIRLMEPLLRMRPVQVHYHRTYQNLMALERPKQDLIKEYRGLVNDEPGTGALWYLLGRLESEPTLARVSFDRARTVVRPSPYAHLGYATLALHDGNAAEALSEVAKCREEGLTDTTLGWLSYEAHIMQRDYAAALADVREMLTQTWVKGTGLRRMAALCLRKARPDARDAEVIREMMGRLKAAGVSDAELEQGRAYWESAVIYAGGDELKASERLLRDMDKAAAAYGEFMRGVALRDYAEANKALAKPDVANGFVLYLLAKQNGRNEEAEGHYKEAAEELMRMGPSEQHVAEVLLGRQASTVDRLSDLIIDMGIKRVALTVLAERDQANRQEFVARAKLFNGAPSFPQLFLQEVLEGFEAEGKKAKAESGN